MEPEGIERRRFSRVKINIEADLSDGRLSVFACQTRDLSLQGVFVLTEVQFPPAAVCDVVLILRGMIDPIIVRLLGRVVRCQEEGVGIQFDEVQGLDCWRHLSNLMLYNAEDPEKILEEQEFLGLHDRTAK